MFLSIIKTIITNLYKINTYLMFFLITYFLLPKTINDLVSFGAREISLPSYSTSLFLHLYIVVAVLFSIVELLNRFGKFDDKISWEVISHINTFMNYLYLFLCLHHNKILAPPLNNGAIVLIFLINIIAFCVSNLLYLFKGISYYFEFFKYHLLAIVVMIILLSLLKVDGIVELIDRLHLNWLIELCQQLT